MIVATAINRRDDLTKGESYYFVELKLLLDLIKKARETEKPYLFLIDEIFRGTNTVERIASSVAVLSMLGKSNLTIVTTHDVEMQDLLSDGFELFHFSETGIPESPFDFKLKSGKGNNRNAILLLERIGYPKEIVVRAQELVAELDS